MMQRFLVVVLIFFSLSTISLWGQAGPSTNSLIQALRQQDLDGARKILRSGVNLNVFDNYGDTPLIVAIRSGYKDFVAELLSAGADPKFTGPGKGTSLMGAVWQRDPRLANELLDRGVPVNAADVHGQTALILAPYNGSDGKMVQLLLEAGANPNASTNDGMTALIVAAMVGDPIDAEKLLKAGADPTVKDKYGKTAGSESCDRGEKGRAEVCAIVRAALVENKNQPRKN